MTNKIMEKEIAKVPNGTKYAWYTLNGKGCDERFDSTKEAIEDARKSKIKDFNIPDVVTICEAEVLSDQDIIEGIEESIEEVNERFSNGFDDSESMIDDKEGFEKSLLELIRKHYSFNPVWMSTAIVGRFNIRYNRWISLESHHPTEKSEIFGELL